jgi:MarR family transcriptional regulator, repressor for mepA
MSDEMPEVTGVSGHLRMIQFKQMQHANNWIKARGLTVEQGRTLGYIEAHQDRDGGVIMRELAEMSRTTAASVSSLVKGLEQRGLIETRADPADSRRKLLFVMPDARGMTEGWDRMVQDLEERMLSPLSPAERETVLDLLARMDAALPFES